MLSKRTAKSLLAIILVCGACSTALYLPNTGNVVSGADVSQLKMGRQLYISKCSSCHSLVLPEKHSPVEWQSWMEKMSARSKVSSSEKTVILKYLTKGN